MTDTPETDAMEYFDAMCDPDRVVEADFARKLERERDRLAEALRKAISWGDSASHHILHRQNINWTYLNEAKEALQSINQDHFPDVGNMIGTTTTEP